MPRYTVLAWPWEIQQIHKPAEGPIPGGSQVKPSCKERHKPLTKCRCPWGQGASPGLCIYTHPRLIRGQRARRHILKNTEFQEQETPTCLRLGSVSERLASPQSGALGWGGSGDWACARTFLGEGSRGGRGAGPPTRQGLWSRPSCAAEIHSKFLMSQSKSYWGALRSGHRNDARQSEQRLGGPLPIHRYGPCPSGSSLTQFWASAPCLSALRSDTHAGVGTRCWQPRPAWPHPPGPATPPQSIAEHMGATACLDR